MFVQHLADGRTRLMTSASDLTAASTCEFAFLRQVDARLGRDIEVPQDDDAMLLRAARLGDAHEARVLERYLADFGPATAAHPGGVVTIERAHSRNESALADAERLTLTALEQGAEVVFQATFFEPVQRAASGEEPEIGFIGYADFLRRTATGAYEVQDTKLARRAKVTALMQLAAYAEQLERLGVSVADEVALILGTGAHSRHRLADIAPVFRARRARLHDLLLARASAVGADGRRETAAPLAWGSDDVTACGRCVVCEPEVLRTRDPMLIAGIRVSQRDRLIDAGLDTIDAIAAVLADVSAGTRSVPGISGQALERIAMQAAVQVGAQDGAPPPYRVAHPEALGAIPAPHPGDLFFDFEGDPLYRESGDDETARWGLDYLFGMVDAHEQFTAFWAHDLDAERVALEQFLDFVAERRRLYPGMHVYHFAPYERTHLLSIAARHGVREAEVDQLLREHVLVDLYPIVRAALRIGARSYSIKKLEPLYMGDELRDTDGVTNGAQSVAEYAEATTQLESSDPAIRAQGQLRLDAIADYNRYDCVSTLRLRDWLLGLAAEHSVQPYPQTVTAADTQPEIELSEVAVALARHASLASDPKDRKAAALAGSAIDYYQREQKSFWWAHYARLIDPIDDWADTRDVMIVDREASELDHDWQAPQGRARLHRRRVRLRGEIAPGSSFKVDREVYAVYDYPAPFAQPNAQPGARGSKLVQIVAVHSDGVTIEETRSNDLQAWQVMPVALTPGPPPRAGSQKEAIEQWGRALAAALDAGTDFRDPVYDLMRRLPPRCVDDTANDARQDEARTDEARPDEARPDEARPDEARPESAAMSFEGQTTDTPTERHTMLVSPSEGAALEAGGSEDARQIGAVIASLRRLDRSALAVQGPPGTGKTYLAARVIRTLVERDGWHIGVVAQSHKVVENVLEGVVAAGLDPDQVGKVPQGGKPDAHSVPPGFTVLGARGHERFLREHREAGRGAVIGGTAWDFSNESRVPRAGLDLLVIDEAGQFSLAPTIASAVAAERLLLLGDPQQLPQVSQGSHPEPVDTSALGWLLGEHSTMPDRLGYFLAETRRMRPELAEVVSELAYEGRLHAHPTASLREVIGAGPAGFYWHPVSHEGNSTSSVEEAAEVVRIARAALGGQLTERPSSSREAASRQLTQRDIIVVAAYNAQVECLELALEAAGLAGIPVGTVDRFQGQEAVIAIVSLAASSADEVPRGLDFLLMRNRLNVAISRAQWAAHLVSSDRLGASLPTTAEGVAALSGYLRLTERALRQPAQSANVEI